MEHRTNQLGQPIGADISNWPAAKLPPTSSIRGTLVRIEKLNVERHLEDLFEAFAQDHEGRLWTYMTVGPFSSIDDFRRWMQPASETTDPFFHALIDLSTEKAVGMAAFMRIKESMGCIEVGSISYSPRMQKTVMATEAMYLMMKRAFDELGYRRYEWKCDSLNEASRNAAERLGFRFEGIFRQAMVYKSRNRDTAWYSILDNEWPAIERAYLNWLNIENFDEQGHQKQKLKTLIQAETG
jgi:RimJ/RimL family protein N-acetyltransferase